MELFGLLLIWIINFVISWHNAYVVGHCWADSKVVGGWPRFLTWCAGIMSACGFTWCYLIPTAFGAEALGYLPHKYAMGTLELGYLVIILPILGSGMAIWIDSLTTAWRERDATSMGVAAWNTYAQIHNTYGAISHSKSMLDHVGALLNSDDSDNPAAALMIALVVLALFGGIITTVAIAKSSAAEYGRDVVANMRRR